MEGLRSNSTIVDHQEYEGMIKNFETVSKLGGDVKVYDWKIAILSIPKHDKSPSVPGTAKAWGN